MQISSFSIEKKSQNSIKLCGKNAQKSDINKRESKNSARRAYKEFIMNKRQPDPAWLEDPAVFAVNRLDACSDHAVFQVEKGDMERSLDGTWKFHFARNLDETIPGFYESDFDFSNWDTIQVPQHI